MILFIFVSLLVIADAGMTQYAVKRWGVDAEGFEWMRFIMKIDYSIIWLFTGIYIYAVYLAYSNGIMGFWGWVANVAVWLPLFIHNVIVLWKYRGK